MTLESLAWGIAGALIAAVVLGVVRGVFAVLRAAIAPLRDRAALVRACSLLREANAAEQRAREFVADHPELRALPSGCCLTRRLDMVLTPDWWAQDPFADIRQPGDETWDYAEGAPAWVEDWSWETGVALVRAHVVIHTIKFTPNPGAKDVPVKVEADQAQPIYGLSSQEGAP